MKKRKNWISYILIFIFTFALLEKFFENDLFFDLKTGESILKYGIDFKDHFSFIPNLTYLYHHWLYDVWLYFLYKKWSFIGIIVFFILLFYGMGIIIYQVCYSYSKNKIVSTFTSIFTIYIISYAFQTRVQSITYLLFFLEVFFLEKLYCKGEKKYLFFVTILSILIANLHMPLWIFTIILYLPYLLETILNQKLFSWLKKYLPLEKEKNSKWIWLGFLILLCTGLFTPLRFSPYTFFLKVLGNSNYSFIAEMKRTILYYWNWEILLLLLFIIGIYMKVLKVKVRDFALILGLFFFSLYATRNIVYILLFLPTMLIKSYYNEPLKYSFPFVSRVKNWFQKVNQKIVYYFTVILLFGMAIFFVIDADLKHFDFHIPSYYPDETVQYIKENLDYQNIRLYNPFGRGSYLLFYDIPVFIDSRAEVYNATFNGGTDIITDYLSMDKIDQYKEIFDKYELNYALVFDDSILASYLKIDSDFEPIFQEENFILYQKIK